MSAARWLSRLWREKQGLPRWWWGVLLAIVILIVVGLWFLRQTLPAAVDPTWERIHETGVLPVCTDPSWPPFEFVNERSNQIDGFDAELAQLLADRLGSGVRAEMVTVGFDGLYDALLTGRCDLVLSALPYEPLRTEDVVFSVAYFNAGQVLVTREETQKIKVLEDLAGRVVGVEWGFVPEADRRQQTAFRDLGMRRYDTAQDTLRALQSGEVEVVVVDRISALAYLRECEGLQIPGEPITDLDYVAPTRLDSFQLREAIDQAVLEMRKDGTLEALQEKWF
ncbi:ABC transporter substrate-binding protein [Chloroflexota bacterium]